LHRNMEAPRRQRADRNCVWAEIPKATPETLYSCFLLCLTSYVLPVLVTVKFPLTKANTVVSEYSLPRPNSSNQKVLQQLYYPRQMC
jgi:hypothetical protein